MFDDTDRHWEKFGKDEPYFGVITSEEFRAANLTEESKEEFFAGGSNYIKRVLEEVRQHTGRSLSIKRALDFGCGVGRVLIPLADIAQEVTGVDVSDSMLKEARKNCEARSLTNVVFGKSDDALSFLKGKYDFIHSYIVFQHIPVERGKRIFEKLLAHLETGGVCVVHFTYAKDYPTRRWASFIKKYLPLSRNFINLIRGRNFFATDMQMNPYDLNHVFSTIQKANVRKCYTTLTNHGGELGIIIGFSKPGMRQCLN
jgi:ubiquinone/menaquinone biosynthesis C-methylase UbiE